MMVVNDNYHEYFNKNGELLPHIKASYDDGGRKAEEASKSRCEPAIRLIRRNRVTDKPKSRTIGEQRTSQFPST